MKQINQYSTVSRIIITLSLCGLTCSIVALFFLNSHKQADELVTLDSYILEVSEIQNQKSLETIKQLDLVAPSENNSIEQAQQVQASTTELINSEQSHEQKININTATIEQLQQIKGIGPSKAKAIIEEREKGGPFKSIEEITRVKGIGKKTFESIKESLVN